MNFCLSHGIGEPGKLSVRAGDDNIEAILEDPVIKAFCTAFQSDKAGKDFGDDASGLSRPNKKLPPFGNAISLGRLVSQPGGPAVPVCRCFQCC
jgi:hypothetical protein